MGEIFSFDFLQWPVDCHWGGGDYLRIDYISNGFHNHAGGELVKPGSTDFNFIALTLLQGGEDSGNATQPPGWVDVKDQLDEWGNLVTPAVTAAQLKQKLQWSDGSTIPGFGFWNNHPSAEFPYVGTATFISLGSYPWHNINVFTGQNDSKCIIGVSVYKKGTIGVGTKFHSWGVNGGLPIIPPYDNNKTWQTSDVTSSDMAFAFLLNNGKVSFDPKHTNVPFIIPAVLDSPHSFGNT